MTDTKRRPRPDRSAPDFSPPVLGTLSDGAHGDRETITFVPIDADRDELLTTWLTVDGNSVVCLDDWR